MPSILPWLQKLGSVEQSEMDRVFNGGLGFIVIASREAAKAVKTHLETSRVMTHFVGEVVEGSSEVVFV